MSSALGHVVVDVKIDDEPHYTLLICSSDMVSSLISLL